PRLEDAGDLRPGAEMDALTDLRARADECMRIHHRVLPDVRADVDVHRRHADDARGDVGAAANRRASGHDADTIREIESMRRERVLVEEEMAGGRALVVVRRHVDDLADAEAKEDAELHPRHRAPMAVL